jgi:hypothetical protein
MSGKSTLKSFKAMMSEARLPERTVDLCLRGDLIAEFQALDAELEQARNAAGDSLAIAALTLNRGKVDIPFSPAASMMKRTSDGE